MISPVRSLLFLGSLMLALVLLITGTQYAFLPSGLAGQIGHNSEALLLALLVAAVIHLRRGLLQRGRPVPVVLLPLSVALAAAGIALAHSGWATSLVTLNESLLGAAFVTVYLCLPRSPVIACLVCIATLGLVVIFFDTDFVLDQAESLVPLILAPLALDVFDRSILQPQRPDVPWLRNLWLGVLVAAAIGSMIAARWARGDLEGPLRLGIDYSQRAAEAYWGWLLIHGYFSLWLGSHWRKRGFKE